MWITASSRLTIASLACLPGTRDPRPREVPHTLTGRAYDNSGTLIGATSVKVKVAGQASRVLASAAWTPVVAGVFSDINESSQYGAAVVNLADSAVVSGFKDGTFGANLPVTRAQVAKMICGMLGIADEELTSTPFVDLDEMGADHYPHMYIAALFSLGSIKGTGANSFSPWETVSRAQLATILIRALRTLDSSGLAEPSASFVSCLGDIDPSHDDDMRIAEYNGLLGGLDGFGSSWDPWAPATRGEVAQLLYNLLSLK